MLVEFQPSDLSPMLYNIHHGLFAKVAIAVIGGFGETSIEEAEKLANDLLKHVHRFHEVSMVDGNSIVGLAQFDTPAHAIKCIRSQKKHPQAQTNKLWVAENPSRMERNQAQNCEQIEKKF